MRTFMALLLSSACCAAAACSTLPEYAEPRGRIVEASEYDRSDVIAYRRLSRADFKGTKPPPAFAASADRIGAATCAYILTTPDTRLGVRGTPTPSGELRYDVVADHLGFHSQMDRRCSWWNTRQTALPESYVLEHEQIHFALFELEARKLNSDRDELARSLIAVASTPEEAAALAQRQLQNEIQRRMSSILKRSREFDEDTSLGYRPERQKAWLARVESELAAGGP